jgi:muramoyltetrapeptide carboxypeptidase
MVGAGFGLKATLKAENVNDIDTLKVMPSTPPALFTNERKNILPMALKEGSTVAITAPASQTSTWEVSAFCRTLNKMGLKTVIGDTIKTRQKEYKYLSASDEERAEEFMSFVEDSDIDCIISGRGGYGVLRILPLLDFDIIAKNPKIIMGFSDITALINAIYQKTGLVTYHGPVAVATFNDFTAESFKNVLYAKEEYKPKKLSYSKIQTVTKGTSQGIIIGGNLTMLVSTLGTPYEINTDDSILFIEEVSEQPYKIDRMLTQLDLAGKFSKIKGIIFGYYEGLDRKCNFYPGHSFTARQVIENRFKSMEIPAILGFPIGHIKDKLTMPIGIMAELDATKKTFTILEQAVRS